MGKETIIGLDELLKIVQKEIKPLFTSKIYICSRCGHSVEDHYWNGSNHQENSGYNRCRYYGCECLCLVDNGEIKTIVNENSLNILLDRIKKSLVAFKDTEEDQIYLCPFCEATRKNADEQIKILKEECEQMKRECDLAWKVLDEEIRRAYNHGYATGQHDCEEALEEGKEE